MIALPIAAEPKVMTNEASSSTSAMPGARSAQMSGVEPEQSADEKSRGAGADREVDREQAEEGDAQERKGRQTALVARHIASPRARVGG
jgi:hypothetical protein